MREIKFRAWEKRNKIMEYINILKKITCFLPCHDINDRIRYAQVACNDYELMQYTGLKDKNGKEIYEGDIVSSCGYLEVVSYGIQEVDAFEGMGFNLWSFMEETTANGKRLSAETKVIGNIHENPELLEEK